VPEVQEPVLESAAEVAQIGQNTRMKKNPKTVEPHGKLTAFAGSHFLVAVELIKLERADGAIEATTSSLSWPMMP
jgi:hypothetical protein